jgi:hypothetical protein
MEQATEQAHTEQREVVSTPIDKGLDFLSSDPMFADESQSNATTTTPVTTEAETAITTTPEETAAANEQSEADKANATATPETTTEAAATTTEATTTETAPEEGFFTKEEVETGVTSEVEDGTWKAIALAKGYEIPADFQDDFESYSKLEEQVIAKKLEETAAKAREDVFAGLKPELRQAIELAQAHEDITLQDILQPTLQIEQYLKMDNEALVRADIEARNPKFTKEMVDVEMQILSDKGLVDHTASVIKIGLEEDKAAIQADHNNRIKAYQEQSLLNKQAQKDKAVSQLNSAIDKAQSFFDKTLTDTDKQVLKAQSASFLEELTSNPDRLAKAMLYDKLGERGEKYFKDKVRGEVLAELAKKQHNVPTTTQGQAANRTVVTKTPASQFDILTKDFGE